MRLASSRCNSEVMAHRSDIAIHGRKRPAEGELDDQPLAKRFGNLQIDNLTRKQLSEFQGKETQRLSRPCKSNDAMMLDDTKHTLFIHDLESELAETDALDGTLTVLPGLEKRLSLASVLVAENKRPCNEIVLYREPESLSIPKEEDQVRRALMETRERARLRRQHPHGNPQPENYQYVAEGAVHSGENFRSLGISEDKMDIDGDI
ncbi:hypothetical protein BDV18DRAFT_46329 [Aspergillus unguis]